MRTRLIVIGLCLFTFCAEVDSDSKTVSKGGNFVQGRPFTRRYTLSNTGCPCWFDIQSNDTRCACCKNDGVQCGYPMNNYCRSNLFGARVKYGCPGIARWRRTLSSTGSPCPWDVTDRSCSWCTTSGWLCPLPNNIDGSGGDTQVQKTYKGVNRNVCISEWAAKRLHRGGTHLTKCKKSDCDNWPAMCSVDATCEKVQITHSWKKKFTHICVCKPGFIGNGIQCVNQDTNTINSPLQGTNIDFNIKVTTELFLGPEGDDVSHLSNSKFSELDLFLGSGLDEDTLGGNTQCQLTGSSNGSVLSRSIDSHHDFATLLFEEEFNST